MRFGYLQKNFKDHFFVVQLLVRRKNSAHLLLELHETRFTQANTIACLYCIFEQQIALRTDQSCLQRLYRLHVIARHDLRMKALN